MKKIQTIPAPLWYSLLLTVALIIPLRAMDSVQDTFNTHQSSCLGKVRAQLIHNKECQILDLSAFQGTMTNYTLRAITQMYPNIKKLYLKECYQLTDTGLANLKYLTHLQVLYLERCYYITDAGLAYLKDVPSLQVLNLSGCNQITDAGLTYFKDLTYLRSLNLTWCRKFTVRRRTYKIMSPAPI